MRDLLLIALYALLGAGGAGLLGAAALRILRRRSVAVSLAIVAAVAVTAMLAGTLTVAWAMFLSSHDLAVVTMVVASAAAGSSGTALVGGRPVV
ncbi:two-component sensor histidine kinase, partial [Streptomyces sp. NPDC059558]